MGDLPDDGAAAMSILGYDIDRIVALSMARIAVADADDASCIRGYDRIVDRYGHELASEVWTIACREWDAAHGCES